MQASFWNLGDFERFGTGSIDETIGYAITPQFSAAINLYQEFYGGNAFPDNMINSPYFRFEPTLSYQLTRNIAANLLFTYGICSEEKSLYPALLGGLFVNTVFHAGSRLFGADFAQTSLESIKTNLHSG